MAVRAGGATSAQVKSRIKSEIFIYKTANGKVIVEDEFLGCEYDINYNAKKSNIMNKKQGGS